MCIRDSINANTKESPFKKFFIVSNIPCVNSDIVYLLSKKYTTKGNDMIAIMYISKVVNSIPHRRIHSPHQLFMASIMFNLQVQVCRFYL